MDTHKLIPKIIARRCSKSLRKDSESMPSSPKKGSSNVSLETTENRGRRRTSDRHEPSVSSRDSGGDGADRRSSIISHLSSSATDLDQELQRPSSSPHRTRPGIPSQHPSLIGYLTTSSPAVQATHLASTTDNARSRSRSLSRHRSPSSSSLRSPLPDANDAIRNPPREAELLVPPKPAYRSSRGPTVKIPTETPRTPPLGDGQAPVIVNTPPTPVELANTSGLFTPEKRSPSLGSKSPTFGGSPTGSSPSIHRRSKSGSATVVPSKLSHSTTAPAAPSPDQEQAHPPATNGTGGFFSSVISAAQNAANTLSNIPGTNISIGGARKASGVPHSQSSPAGTLTDPMAKPDDVEVAEQPKGAAVHTLGAGELSLSQLGLADPVSNVASPASIKFPDLSDSRLRSESAPVEAVHLDAHADLEPGSRPRSLLDEPSADELAESQELPDMKSSVHRTSSVRSAIKAHRKRGSSTTTGAIVAAGVLGAQNAVPQSSALGAPKLTGFAIAAKKRNRDFHSFFKSVPDDDYLIEDYSCALQREILAHGRLYVSEGHLCFSSNILGWTTTLVMSFDEIVSVEKRSTALVFKNGLMISTLHAKHIFASFTSRDATYDLIVNIWKLGHPTLKSTLNGVQLEGTGGDKTEKVDVEPQGLGIETSSPIGSDSDDLSDEDDEDDFYDEDEDELGDTQPTEVSVEDGDKPVSRKVSAMSTANGGDGVGEGTSTPGAVDFPGPATHAPTECGDTASHYDKLLGDGIIPAPIGKVYQLMFGAGSKEWMSKWLASDQKCWDISMEDKKGLSLDNKSRTYSYMKPLNSLAPKQTKCNVSETVENLDYEKAINVSGATTTPDVPSGNLFTVKTKYCLSWAENNATRLQINCTVEWSGKSWIKGMVEKGVSDGQGQYCKDIIAGLKAAVSARARSATVTGKTKKRSRKSKSAQFAKDSNNTDSKQASADKISWGPLEPMRPLLEPFLDLLKPVLTGNVMYGLLVGLLVASWFRFGLPNRSVSYGRDAEMFGSDRLSAFEEMWRQEDSQLWEWLEERSGLDRLGAEAIQIRKRAIEPRSVEQRLREERMDEREVQEAIRVTEEKLRVLRDVVSRSKDESTHVEL